MTELNFGEVCEVQRLVEQAASDAHREILSKKFKLVGTLIYDKEKNAHVKKK